MTLSSPKLRQIHAAVRLRSQDLQAETERFALVKSNRGAISQVHKKQQQLLEKAMQSGKDLRSNLLLKRAQQKALQKTLQSMDEKVKAAFESLVCKRVEMWR